MTITNASRHSALSSALVALVVLTGGCAIVAPNYSPSIDNVQLLKNGKIAQTKVGSFQSAADPANANPISLRGSSLQSPYANSYAAYLTEALRLELSLAGKLDANSTIEISGVLLRNDLDASGVSKGFGEISANFVVTRNGVRQFDKTKSARLEWESSFVGAIAIPNAQQSYPRMVKNLLSDLFSDPEFVKALQ
ncbi:MAG: hypothetical protein HZB40_02580 [Rhodocyclales bacterium]|nr:hypothetical protein [Rhodocyclales bacterium]